jgi:hypothetical protein
MPKPSFPTIPLSLLEALENRFPDRLPDHPCTEAQAAELIGQQQVIRILRREYEKQTDPKGYL